MPPLGGRFHPRSRIDGAFSEGIPGEITPYSLSVFICSRLWRDALGGCFAKLCNHKLEWFSGRYTHCTGIYSWGWLSFKQVNTMTNTPSHGRGERFNRFRGILPDNKILSQGEPRNDKIT